MQQSEKLKRGAKAKQAVSRTASRRRARANGGSNDAIALLEADHKVVKAWFKQYEKLESDRKKGELAARNFAQLCGDAGARLGLRVTPGSAKLAKQLLNDASDRAFTIVLAGTDNYRKLRKDACLRAGDRA